MQKYGQDKQSGNVISCPMCRQNFVVPPGGFQTMPNNFFIQQLLEKGEGLNNVSNKLDNLCDLCNNLEDGNNITKMKATVFCLECDLKLCTSCSSLHTKQRFSQSHDVVALDEMLDKKTSVRHRMSYCEYTSTKKRSLIVRTANCCRVSLAFYPT